MAKQKQQSKTQKQKTQSSTNENICNAQGTTQQAKQPHGRPTSYNKQCDQLAYNYALLGATDQQIADYFNISVRTLNNWKITHASFLQSLNNGKQVADGKVAAALYNRACGSTVVETDVRLYLGRIYKTKIEKQFPPDTVACIFWLKNRQRKQWTDRPQENSTDENGNLLMPTKIEVVIKSARKQINCSTNDCGTNDCSTND